MKSKASLMGSDSDKELNVSSQKTNCVYSNAFKNGKKILTVINIKIHKYNRKFRKYNHKTK